MMHVEAGVHGPLKKTVAVLGSKPVPLIVKLNTCESPGGVGVVEIDVSWGIGTEETDTVNVRLFDDGPFDPFCTVTVKLPPVSVAVPLSCVALAADSALFATVQGVDVVQPGPVKITVALFGSNVVPVIVKVKATPFSGGVGVVEIAVS